MTKYKLEYPFEFEGKTIESVDVKRLKVKHVKQLEVKDPDYIAHMLALAVGLPLEACDEIDLVDFLVIQEKMGGSGFLPEKTS